MDEKKRSPQDNETGTQAPDFSGTCPWGDEVIEIHPEDLGAGRTGKIVSQDQHQDNAPEHAPEIGPDEQPEAPPMETPEKPKRKNVVAEEIEKHIVRPKKYSVKKGERVPGLTTGATFDAKELRCMLTPEQMPSQGWGNEKYHESFPQIAYAVLSAEALRTKSSLAVAFCCSKPTITRWIRKHEAFRRAVEAGLAAGEQLFRQKCADASFQPSNTVNNGLIKMLGGNVYGIKDDAPSTIIVESSKPEKSVEELMKEKGIPLPSFDSPSMYDMNQNLCAEGQEDMGPGLDEMEEEEAPIIESGSIDPKRGVVMSPAIPDKPNTVTQDAEDRALANEEKKKNDRERIAYARKIAKKARQDARDQGKGEKAAQAAYKKGMEEGKAEWNRLYGKGRKGRKPRAQEIQDNIQRKLLARLEKMPFTEKEGKKIVNPDVPVGEEVLSPATRARLELLDELTGNVPRVQGAGSDFNDADIVTGVNPFGIQED